MSKVSGKSQVKETLLKVAEKRNDSALASRIASVNLVDKKAWYHRKCYQASLLPKDNLLRTYLTSLQLVTGTVWRR